MDNWITPDWLYKRLILSNRPYNLDVAADYSNAKTPTFFSKEDDALSRNWDVFGDQTTAWCNPPYSAYGDWLQKAYEESVLRDVWSMCLVPFDVSTRAYYFAMHHAYSIRVFYGKRIAFIHPETRQEVKGGRSNHMVVCFGPAKDSNYVHANMRFVNIKEQS